MSHYTRMATRITRKECLIKALKSMGFQEHMIESSETPLPLKGYSGDIRAGKQCHVRIKGSGWRGQNHVGGASNDLGWERMEDGTYALHVSDYDRIHSRYGTKWQKKLMQEYSREVIKEVVDEQSFFIHEEVEVDGEIHIKAYSSF